MNSVNKTLYIPLYGKAYVSRKGLILEDRKAEAIWAAEGFPLKGKSRSRWLAYYMGMRSAVFDGWLRQKLAAGENTVVIHIGCGMDSRVERVGTGGHLWYDVDFPEVIRERRRYYTESADYRMLPGDAREPEWLTHIPPGKQAVVVMEGVSMYLTVPELDNLTMALSAHFGQVSILLDHYTVLAARLTKYKNPINDVGVTQVYGMDDPTALAHGGLAFVKEHDITPPALISELRGTEKYIFRKLYAGSFARKLYRLYEYEKR